MKTVKIIKSKDNEFPSDHKIYFFKAYRTMVKDGMAIYTYPWAVDKFLYAFISYVTYMFNPDIRYVIVSNDMLDINLLVYLRNSIVFFDGTQFNNFDEARDYFAKDKKIQLKMLNRIWTLPKGEHYKMTVFWDGLNKGMFPVHEDDEMIGYWKSDKICRIAKDFMEYIK